MVENVREKLSFHLRNIVLHLAEKFNFPLIVFFLVGEKVNVCIAASLLVENLQ